MEQEHPENETAGEEAANLVYAFAAGRDFRPGESGTVYAAMSAGLQVSRDGGQTWQDALTSLELIEPLPVTSVVASYGQDAAGVHVLAGVSGGVFRSVDNGESWRALLLPSPPPTVTALAVSPDYSVDATVFAGTMEDGVFISKDGGQSWVAWNFGFLDLNVLCLAISPNFATDETLLAGTETGIFRSTNGGRAWREVELPFGFAAVLSLAFSPNFADDQTVFAGTEENGLWVSTDGGESWQQSGEIEAPVNGIYLHGSQILVLTSDSVLRSAGGGQSWQNCLPTLEEGRELSAILVPGGFEPGQTILAGFVDGAIEAVKLQ